MFSQLLTLFILSHFNCDRILNWMSPSYLYTTIAYQKLEERGIRDGMTKSTRSGSWYLWPSKGGWDRKDLSWKQVSLHSKFEASLTGPFVPHVSLFSFNSSFIIQTWSLQSVNIFLVSYVLKTVFYSKTDAGGWLQTP